MSDTFRLVYTPLSDEQKAQMERVKSAATDLESLLDLIVPKGERSERSRCMNIARTNLETSIMYAVKGITSPKEDK